ncbi:MAG TPA: hypothetical protein DEO36_10180 [Flavobacteriaceae bacterium]|nr:hypothetical protein [Flavobacteriaceae bacterium]
MKKLTIVFTLLIIFNSCTNDSEEDQFSSLIGDWSNVETIDNERLSQSSRYSFNSDKTFVVSTVIIKNDTNEILGYRYRAIGIYSVNENKLTLKSSEIYTHDDSKDDMYSNIDELKTTNENFERSFKFFIDQNKKIVTFIYPPCDPLEDCLDKECFKRINEN